MSARSVDENGRRIGQVRRRFSYFHRVVTVADDHGQELLRIVGPVWRPWTFTLYHRRREVGSIAKKWSGVLRESFTDADNFSIRFKPALGKPSKRLALGALMLIDSLCFEGRQQFIQHFISAPGIQLLLALLVGGVFWFSRMA